MVVLRLVFAEKADNDELIVLGADIVASFVSSDQAELAAQILSQQLGFGDNYFEIISVDENFVDDCLEN